MSELHWSYRVFTWLRIIYVLLVVALLIFRPVEDKLLPWFLVGSMFLVGGISAIFYGNFLKNLCKNELNAFISRYGFSKKLIYFPYPIVELSGRYKDLPVKITIGHGKQQPLTSIEMKNDQPTSLLVVRKAKWRKDSINRTFEDQFDITTDPAKLLQSPSIRETLNQIHYQFGIIDVIKMERGKCTLLDDEIVTDQEKLKAGLDATYVVAVACD